MTDPGWFFLYTPAPWLALMYVVAYRHDLSRIARPFRDSGDLRAWWSVCVYLNLIPAEAPEPPRKIWRTGPFIAVLAALPVSLLWLTPIASWVWYYLALLQVASALFLFLGLANRIGRFPAKPYSDTFPYPRLGSRIRHLPTEGRGRSAQQKAAVNATVSPQTGGATT